MHTVTITHELFQAKLSSVIKGNVYQVLISKLLCFSKWCTIIRQTAQLSTNYKDALQP